MRKLLLLGILFPLIAEASWSLDSSRSEISFISIKNLAIAETHDFKSLEGTLDQHGKLKLTIDLDSVQTRIPIRDERMRNLLFETANFRKATISSVVDLSFSQSMSVGDIHQSAETFTLEIRGHKSSAEVDLAITLTRDGNVRVDSVRPVIINASNYDMTTGIEALRVIAKLASISEAVPVSFNLFFKKY